MDFNGDKEHLINFDGARKLNNADSASDDDMLSSSFKKSNLTADKFENKNKTEKRISEIKNNEPSTSLIEVEEPIVSIYVCTLVCIKFMTNAIFTLQTSRLLIQQHHHRIITRT